MVRPLRYAASNLSFTLFHRLKEEHLVRSVVDHFSMLQPAFTVCLLFHNGKAGLPEEKGQRPEVIEVSARGPLYGIPIEPGSKFIAEGRPLKAFSAVGKFLKEKSLVLFDVSPCDALDVLHTETVSCLPVSGPCEFRLQSPAPSNG